MERIIFHIDVNSAFLSWSAVEKLKKNETPDIRTIPSIIGGDTKSRHGIVLAKSVPAKAYDIHTAEPVAQALRKCPNLVVVPPDHALYKRCSHALMALLRSYTPDIEQLSIDECFLDFTPIASQYESPSAAAMQIKEEIKSRFGFTVNIGIAPNKVLAKMASDFQKPDRIHTLFYDEIPVKMWPLPVDDLYMVGQSSARRLKSLGIRTIGELAHTDKDYLHSEFKSHGITMWEYANGIGSDTLHPQAREAKGVGNSTTLSTDISDMDEIKRVLLALSEKVSARLRKSHQLAQTVTVEIKYSDFTSCSHQSAFFAPTNTTNELYAASCQLFSELWDKRPIRLLGIRTARLVSEDAPRQLSIFDLAASDGLTTPAAAVFDPDKNSTRAASAEKQKRLDAAVDSIRNRFGQDSIVRGSMLH